MIKITFKYSDFNLFDYNLIDFGVKFYPALDETFYNYLMKGGFKV